MNTPNSPHTPSIDLWAERFWTPKHQAAALARVQRVSAAELRKLVRRALAEQTTDAIGAVLVGALLPTALVLDDQEASDAD